MLKTFKNIENKLRYKKLLKNLKEINSIHEKIKNEPDEFFMKRTHELMMHLENGINEDVILPEAFAIMVEATKRTIGIEQFDVQKMGGVSLVKGFLTEMKTGEGKTFVTVFPAYFNFLKGEKTHISTANRYLAERDYGTLKNVFNFVGISSSLISPSSDNAQKIKNHSAYVSFGTIFDYIFDYLGNNLIKNPSIKINASYDNIILDEADHILIDEARKPVNLTGTSEVNIELYEYFDAKSHLFNGKSFNEEIEELDSIDTFDFDYLINIKNKSIELTDNGFKKLEKFLIEDEFINEKESIYVSENLKYLTFLHNAIKSNKILNFNTDYIIEDDEIVIIDENSGRPEKGSRWGNGLHQALEAKEGLVIKPEAEVKATITIQNFLKLYKQISGMTGTALSDEEEFKEIYNLDVCVIPTNKPNARVDENDLIYEKKEYSLNAILEDVKSKNKLGRPILIGTTDLASSEEVSALLSVNNIKHNLLNAKNHQEEASIIAQAGKMGAITVATNMAGRGTDIVLGGNKNVEILILKEQGLSTAEAEGKWNDEHDAVVAAGGLHIIGLERGESRRLDNQLIGRAGRQGDPGSSIFYLSLDDKLLKIFGSSIVTLWETLAFGKGGINHRFIDKTIYNGQKKIEGSYFNQRKYLLKYDNINGEQRDIIYTLRNEIMSAENLIGLNSSYVNFACKMIVNESFDERNFKTKKQDNFINKIKTLFDFDIDFEDFCKKEKIDDNLELITSIDNFIFKKYQNITKDVPEPKRIFLEKYLLLSTIDNLWEKHLSFLNSLRKNSDLSANAQEDPVANYKNESLMYFKRLIEQIKIDHTSSLCHFSIDQLTNEINELQQNKADNEIPVQTNNLKKLPIFLHNIGF